MGRLLVALLAFACAIRPIPGAAADGHGWKIPFCGSESEPVAAEGVIYIGSCDGALYAIEVASGKTRWNYQTGAGLSSSHPIVVDPQNPQMAGVEAMLRHQKDPFPARRVIDATPIVDRGTVYFPSGDRSFYALDAASGALKWKLDLPRAAFGAVASDGHLIFSAGNQVYAVEQPDGRVAWTFEAFSELPKDSRQTPSVPVVVVGSAYVSAKPPDPERGPLNRNRFHVFAINTRTGRSNWSFETQNISPWAPLLGQGLVWITVCSTKPNSETIVALDASSGVQRWIFKTGEDCRGTMGPPLLVGGLVIVATHRALYGVDVATGNQVWRTDGDWRPNNLHQDGLVLAVSGVHGRSPKLNALDGSSGKTVWSVSIDNKPWIQGTSGGVVYVSGESSLTAITVDTGQKRWRFKTDGTELSAGPAITEGKACFATGIAHSSHVWGFEPVRGSLYCIDARTGEP